MFRYLIVPLLTLSFATGLAGCGDTWQGAKQDTSDNMKSTGQAIEKSADKVAE